MLAATALALGLGLSVAAPAAESTFVTIGTGGVTGVYYPTGGAICRLVNRGSAEHGIRCTVESTGGSVYNVNTIRRGDLDMGVAQSDIQAAAQTGTGGFEKDGPFTDLRAVFSLHPEPMHLVVRADAGIKAIGDLKGKRVNIGNPGSGQRATTELIMAAQGWTKESFSLATELKSSELAKALCDNKVDAVFFTVGIPNGSIKEATTICDSALVPMEGPWVDKLIADHPAFARGQIPGGTYRGNDRDVTTFGPVATVVASTKVPAAVVYQVTKAVFANFDTFRKLHPAFASLDPTRMIKDGLAAPLHEGAIRYYKEAGLM